MPASRRTSYRRTGRISRRSTRTTTRAERARRWATGAAAAAAAAAGLVWGAPVAAAAGGCLTTTPPPIERAPLPLRFGITPQPAGSAGPTQAKVAPAGPRATIAALHALQPPGRELVLRLNRLFWSDGERGIRRFARTARRYARAGFASEIQLRYHPPAGHDGDVEGFVAFVRAAVRRLAADRAVAGFSVTNEANFPVSPNTSDGAYDGVVQALVRGVVAAREELVRLGRPGLPVGFTVAWRYLPSSDARFWRDVGAAATPAFRRALSYVGVQVYPGLVWPPVLVPGRSAGREVLDALTLVRRCYMPMAGLGDGVALWVTENGYPTNLGRTEAEQAVNLDSTVRTVHAYSGELGVTDYRYFNLRDNDSDGTGLFAAVGLLRDDGTPKPAFALYRGLVGRFGAPPPAPRLRLRRRCVARGRLRAALHGDVWRVRDVSFKLGRRLVRRDTRAPFRRTIGRRALAHAHGRPLRAVAYLRGAGVERAILARRLPRCARR